MTEICMVDQRTNTPIKPEKQMRLNIYDNGVSLETSDKFIMFSINLKEKKIYFEDLKNYSADQIAEPSVNGYYHIKDRC